MQLTDSGFSVYTDVNSFLNKTPNKKIFALLDDETLPQASKRNYRLSQLVGKALEALSQDNDGFVLMVEGSQIDWGAHDKIEKYMLGELKDFETAIDTVLDFAARDKNTLVLITADHETGGVSITRGQKDGSDMKIEFSTVGHTPVMVGIFAKGPGEELFNGIQQNNEIGRKLFTLLKKKK